MVVSPTMLKLTFVFLIAMIATLTAAPPASADVISAAPGSLVVRTIVEVTAAPDAVYDALTARVGEWWSATQTWSGNAQNLSIDARAGGCFCEKLSNGGTVQHMQVVWAERGTLLRMSGAPGPLQENAVIATMSWRLTKIDTGTRLEFTFAASGHTPIGFDKMASPADQAFAVLVNRLARYASAPKP
jgi:uncharacterized protein YndB with AHSA1/START domain